MQCCADILCFTPFQGKPLDETVHVGLCTLTLMVSMCSWRECTGSSATGSHDSFTISACWSWMSRWSSALYSSNKRCRWCSSVRRQSIKASWSLFHSDSTSAISFCRTRLTFWARSSGETSGRQVIRSHLNPQWACKEDAVKINHKVIHSFVLTGYCVCVCIYFLPLRSGAWDSVLGWSDRKALTASSEAITNGSFSWISKCISCISCEWNNTKSANSQLANLCSESVPIPSAQFT